MNQAIARSRHKIAFVVPTKDRPGDLRRMLRSVEGQAVRPDQVVVVDGGDRTVEDILQEVPGLPLEYVRVYPPSLSRQRNAGMERLRADITLAGYLDDDLVLEPGALEAMLAFWEAAGPEVGGAAFNITTDRRPHGTWLKWLFLIDSWRPGAILKSGYNVLICPVAETTYVDWVFGGATIWRREVIRAFAYDEWYEGTGYLEDLDYSFRVSRRYRLAVVAAARVQHYSPPLRADRNFLLGKWQVINRLYFVRKHAELSVLCCLWALFGQACINLGKSVVSREPGLWRRFVGNVCGALSVMSGRLERIGGTLK